MSNGISRLSYRFKSYHYTENDSLTYLRKQLKHIYENTQEISESKNKSNKFEDQIRIKSNINVIKNIKNTYKTNTNCNSPWIDASLWNQISSIDKTFLPTSISSASVRFTSGSSLQSKNKIQSSLFNAEVKDSDHSCIERYISNSRHLSSLDVKRFSIAGLQAAKQLRIIPSFGNICTTKDPIFSTKDTSKNTNSGWPFFKKKNSDLCINDTISWLTKFLNKPNYHTLFKNPLFENPTSLFHRVQPSMDSSKCNIKIRQVWCVPQRIIALEHYFFHNILKSVYSNNLNSVNCIYSSGLTNYEISTRMISRIRDYLSYDPSNTKKVFSLDYSKYDSTIPNFGVDLFFSIIRENSKFTDIENKAFECLRCYTRNTPLCYGNNVYIKTKGIMSGSYITNLYDTWFNLLLWNISDSMERSGVNAKFHENSNDFLKEVKFSQNLNHKLRFSIGLCGDDVIIWTSFNEISNHKKLCESLGMKIVVNCQYSSSSENIFFLGRYWDKYNRPIQTETYVISHICVRTKFYKVNDVGKNVIDNIDLFRILSICLPLYNGRSIMDKYFYNWEPLKKFYESNKDFILLKEWPNNGYKSINRLKAFNWRVY